LIALLSGLSILGKNCALDYCNGGKLLLKGIVEGRELSNIYIEALVARYLILGI
jgi:hypothetical protein